MVGCSPSVYTTIKNMLTTSGKTSVRDDKDPKTPATSDAPSKEGRVAAPYSTSLETEEFEVVEPSVSTGDVAVLQRAGQESPHYGIFVRAGALDPNFPLLLVKTQTKPLRVETFDRNKRNPHLVTAQNRIFYGDYESVTVLTLAKRRSLITAQAVIALVDKIKEVPYSDSEVEAIMSGSTPEEKSAIASTLTLALVFRDLGLLERGLSTSSSIRPTELMHRLPLADGTKGGRHIRIPKPQDGPMASGDAPLLSHLIA